MSKPTAIDVSKFQGTMNFAKAKTAGVDTVFCRCAYATTEDKTFTTFATNAMKQGLTVGSYFYATWHYSSNSKTKASALNLAKLQTNKIISILKKVKINGYVALDLEFENNCNTKLTKAEMTDIANTVCDMIKNAGYKPMLYASISWLYEYMLPANIKHPLWVAYYNSQITSNNFCVGSYADKFKAIKDKVYFVQFTEKGTGSAYGAGSKYIDLNYCYKKTTTNNKPSTSSKPSVSYTKGKKLTLKNVPLYRSATSSSPVCNLTGTYYLYDGKNMSGKYRITNALKNCGRTPIASFVTGYINKSDIS